MRTIVAALALVMMVVGAAHADDKTATADANKKAAAKAKALKPLVGKLVISPDAPPSNGDELPDYIMGNLSSDGAYELIKGPPWPFHVALVLPRATKSVTLVVTDKADAKAAPLLTAPIATGGDHKLVLANAEANIAAGFAAHKVYVVKVVAGKKTLAKAELLLRD
jgi:hypothetical protein